MLVGTDEMNNVYTDEMNALDTREINALNASKGSALSLLCVLPNTSCTSNLILPLN